MSHTRLARSAAMGGESEEAVETAGVRVVEVEMGTAEVAMETAAAEGWTARVRAAMVRALGEAGTATAAVGMGRGEVAGDSSQNTSLSGLSGSGELQVESLVGCPLVLLTVSNS